MAEVIRQARRRTTIRRCSTITPKNRFTSGGAAGSPKAQRIVLYAKDRGYSHDGHRAFRAAVPR